MDIISRTRISKLVAQIIEDSKLYASEITRKKLEENLMQHCDDEIFSKSELKKAISWSFTFLAFFELINRFDSNKNLIKYNDTSLSPKARKAIFISSSPGLKKFIMKSDKEITEMQKKFDQRLKKNKNKHRQEKNAHAIAARITRSETKSRDNADVTDIASLGYLLGRGNFTAKEVSYMYDKFNKLPRSYVLSLIPKLPSP